LLVLVENLDGGFPMLTHRFAERPKCRILTSLTGSAACKTAVSSSIGSGLLAHLLLDQSLGTEILAAFQLKIPQRIARLGFLIGLFWPVGF
jgi:hypothetical protein